MKSEHSRKMRRFEELLRRERKMERRRKREVKTALLEVLVDKGYPAQDILDLLDLFDKEVSS